jgi:kynurenine formamidase
MKQRPPAGRSHHTGLWGTFLPAVVLLGAAFAAGCSPAPPPAPSAAVLLASTPADRLVDLSHPFDSSTIYWPTNPPFRHTVDSRGTTPAGFWYASSSFCASEHGGTHLDAPYHFAETGWTVDQIPVRRLVTRVFVLDVRESCASDPAHAVTVEEIRGFESSHGAIPEGSLVVLRTGWEKRWPDRKFYLGDDVPGRIANLRFPGFSEEAARYLSRERRVAGVGIDTASLDPGPSSRFPAHRVFAAANVYGLENLTNLGSLPASGATVVALPMKIGGGTGGPVRVLAVLP